MVHNWFRYLKSLEFFGVLKKSSAYFGAQILMQGLGIISFPVLTYFLSTAEYGITSVFSTYTTLLCVLFTLNISGAIGRYQYEEVSDKTSFNGSVLLAGSLIILVMGLPFLLFPKVIGNWLNLPPDIIPWIVIFCFFYNIWIIYEQLQIALGKTKKYVVLQISLHYLKFIIAVGLLVLALNKPYASKIIGEILATILIACIILYRIQNQWEWSLQRKHLLYAISFGTPYLLTSLSGNLLHSFDQWYINVENGNHDAGLYAFAYKIGLLIFYLSIAILNGGYPVFSNWMNEKNMQAVHAQIISMSKMLAGGVLVLIAFGTEFGNFLSMRKEYIPGLILVPPIVTGYYFYGICQFENRSMVFLKKNWDLSVIMIVTTIINVILNFQFIPKYGYTAAAYTTLCSYIIMYLLCRWYVTKKLLLPVLVRSQLLLQASCVVIMCIVTLYFCSMPFAWSNFFIKSILLSACLLAIFYSKISGMFQLNNVSTK